MPDAQEFSIQVQSQDPEKKGKPKGEEPASAPTKPVNDKKDGEELVRGQLRDQSRMLTIFSVRRGPAAKGTIGNVG